MGLCSWREHSLLVGVYVGILNSGQDKYLFNRLDSQPANVSLKLQESAHNVTRAPRRAPL